MLSPAPPLPPCLSTHSRAGRGAPALNCQRKQRHNDLTAVADGMGRGAVPLHVSRHRPLEYPHVCRLRMIMTGFVYVFTCVGTGIGMVWTLSFVGTFCIECPNLSVRPSSIRMGEWLTLTSGRHVRVFLRRRALPSVQPCHPSIPPTDPPSSPHPTQPPVFSRLPAPSPRSSRVSSDLFVLRSGLPNNSAAVAVSPFSERRTDSFPSAPLWPPTTAALRRSTAPMPLSPSPPSLLLVVWAGLGAFPLTHSLLTLSCVAEVRT